MYLPESKTRSKKVRHISKPTLTSIGGFYQQAILQTTEESNKSSARISLLQGDDLSDSEEVEEARIDVDQGTTDESTIDAVHMN